MTTPAQVFDYDMEARTRTLRKTQEVPSGHDPADYVTRRLLAPAADGESVPISLLYKKGTPLDGSAPLFLYGYGAYGIAMPASFSTSRLSLVDRGFVFAIAHIRGGKDKGYRWYTEGKREKKLNTFTDFIAAGEFLVKEGYTRRGRIVANGGSAGGMLMGVIANMAPDLFLGIIADVPFVDVLNTMLDESLPLTPPEWPEWGNPIASKRDFEIIRSYSPYENVAAKAYPHIFAFAGLTDPRVTYWEPAKWIARLRHLNTGQNLLLLEDQHGGRPRRRIGPLRGAQGAGARLRLRAEDCGQGLTLIPDRRSRDIRDGASAVRSRCRRRRRRCRSPDRCRHRRWCRDRCRLRPGISRRHPRAGRPTSTGSHARHHPACCAGCRPASCRRQRLRRSPAPTS